jgi:type I restriction enzyme S subunit
LAVPKLRFKEFNNEWKKEKIKKIATINPKNDTLPNKFIYIDLESVEKGVLINKNTITKDNAPSRAQRTIKLNDILFQTVRPYQQNNYFVKEMDIIPYIASTGYALIRTSEDPYFLYTLMYRHEFLNKVLDMCTGTSFPAINSNDLGTIEINIPKKKEQEKIGKLLQLLDQKVELQQKKIEALKIYKIGLIQESYNNNCGNKIKMKDLIIQKSIRNAKNEVANVYSVSNKEGFILQSEQFKDRTVASEDTQNYKIVEKNDFAYNPARINVGSIARMKQDVKGIISPMYICFRGNEKIIPEYLEYFFKSYKFTYEMNKRLEGSVRMCLSYESMINIPIALPCIEEQRKVSDLFNSVGHKINQEERKLKKLNEIKKGLLQKMFI